MRFTDYFAFQVRRHPDEPCLVDERLTLTYAEAEAASDLLARALASLPAQSRVAVLADNCIEYLMLDLATTKANLVLVPINTRLIPDEWAAIIEHSGAAVVLVGGSYCERLETVRDRLGAVTRWVVIDRDGQEGWTSLNGLLAEAQPASGNRPAPDEDLALQLYTSGTTGLPKGVMHSHRSMTISVTQWAQVVEPWDGLRGRCLIAAPLFHGATLIMWRTAVSWGSPVQVQARFDPEAVLDAACQHPIAWTFLVPSMIHACLERARSRPETDYDFNLIMYGGSPIAEVVLREALAQLGRHFVQIYGLTEALLTTTLSPRDHERALAGEPQLLLSAGRPIAGVTLSVEHDEAPALPSGQVGEVVISCPNPMKGYWHNPDATKQMIRDGRLHSGDAGYVDDDGYLYICDRVKDMIVTGGENVFSTEVEAVLHAHPGVADVAVIGTPDPRWGEVVTAILVAADGHKLDADEVIAFCRQRISPYKSPKRVEVVAALPRNSTGKLLKRKLREQYWRDHARSI